MFGGDFSTSPRGRWEGTRRVGRGERKRERESRDTRRERGRQMERGINIHVTSVSECVAFLK